MAQPAINPIRENQISRNIPEPPIANFAIPLIWCGIVLCAAGGAAVYQICKDSLTGKPITCPVKVDVPLGISRTMDDIARAALLAKAYAEWLAALLACEVLYQTGQLTANENYQCVADAGADFKRKTGKDVFDYQAERGRGQW